MSRFIIYAILIYLVYLAIKWAFRFGERSGAGRKLRKNDKSKINLKNIEDAEFTEVKKDRTSKD